MSRLDLLLDYVNCLDAKSLELLKAANRTSSLSSTAIEISKQNNIKDRRISTLNKIIQQNGRHIQQLDLLSRKFFDFEASLSITDPLTQQNILENFNNEWKFTVEQYKQDLRNLESENFDDITANEIGKSDYVKYSETQQDDFKSTPVTPNFKRIQFDFSEQTNFTNNNEESGYEDDDVNEKQMEAYNRLNANQFKLLDGNLPSHGLVTSSSISDIRLKPIQCRSKKIYKKKSKYRLSSIYNINPLIDSPTLESYLNNTPTTMNEYDIDSPEIDTCSSLYTHKTKENNFHQDDDDEANIEGLQLLTICTTPEYNRSSKFLQRSNSVPSLNIFHSIDNMHPSNILNGFHDSKLEKLKHFVSMGAIKHDKWKEFNYQNSTLDNIPQESTDVVETLRKSPFEDSSQEQIRIKSEESSKLYDLDAFDMDNVSVCSDFSYYSPERQENEEDIYFSDNEFANYLRASKVNLNSMLPNVIRKSNSHDSIFSENFRIQPQPCFHNPIMSLSSLAAKAVEPTLNGDYIYVKNEANLPNEFDKEILGENSKSLLSKVMASSKNISSTTSTTTVSTTSTSIPNSSGIFITSSPSKLASGVDKTVDPPSSPFKLFNFSGSDLIFNSGESVSGSPSFSKSLMKLVGSKEKPENKPQKSVQMPRAIPTNDPISIVNPLATKRMPIVRKDRTDGSHSMLTVGRDRTTMSHGQSSYFKRPLVTKLSKNSLQEALNFNLYSD